jgi:phytoene dehydrogenase-like protein
MNTAVVVGSGPNGLSGAIVLARAGYAVTVLEASDRPGGGLKSFTHESYGTVHDHCSAVHPLARLSPFFRSLGLEDAVEFVTPSRAFAHPLGSDDVNWPGPTPPGTGLERLRRAAVAGAAAFGGVASHAMIPPSRPVAVATGALLGGAALTTGWPIPIGGSQRIADFLVHTLESLGGTVRCGARVRPATAPEDFPEIAAADIVLWDTDVRVAQEAASGVPAAPRRYGLGAAKADFVTSAPIPWRDARVAQAGTVHLGGPWSRIAASEKAAARGEHPERPVTLVSQPTRFDPTRAPLGLHTVWAYAHVPAHSTEDPRQIITREIERWAPGFADTVLDARCRTAEDIELHNANFVGGDIASGATQGLQLLTSGTGLNPWALPRPGWFLCSGATPPGPGVHGMSGVIAAQLALRSAR